MGSIIVAKSVSADSVVDEICDCVSGDVTDVVLGKIRHAILQKFVGQWVYFPQGLLKAERNKEMLGRLFAGEPRERLRREYRLSRSQFHRIVKEFHQGRKP